MNKQISIEYDERMLTKAFLQLMPVAILTMIIPSINSVIDVTVASRFVGVDAVTAIGFYNPLIYILQGISTILLGGTVILMGKFLGSGKSQEANELFSTDVTSNFLLLTLCGFIFYIFATPISSFLGAKDEILTHTVGYIRGVALSYPATYGITHLSSFLELEQKHARNYIGVAAMLVLNISMDIFFVAYLGMGVFGLGLATSIASWVDFLIFCQYYCTKQAQLRFSIKSFNFKMFPDILKIGFPGAVIQIYLAARGYMTNRMLMASAGEIGIAALSAQSTMGSLEYGATYGISVASRTLFSIFVGSNDSDSIRHVLKIAVKKIIPGSLVFAILMASLSVPFTRIFYAPDAGDVYKLTVQLFVCFPLAMFLSGFAQIFSTYYQCHMWLKITNILSFFDGFAGMAISMLILTPFFGALGVWMSFIGNGVIVGIVILIYTIIKCKKFPTKADDYLIFPKDFDIPDEHRMNFSVHNNAEVVMCSRRIDEFCKKENVDARKSYFSALALEEMADNIVEKGFRDKAKHTCVIEVANSPREIILRIMDDGIDFNPLHRLEVIDPDDFTKNIGIRLVRGIADDMEYTRVIGLNILTIKIRHGETIA